MFRHAKRTGWWMVLAVAIGMFCSSQTAAKKPEKPPGGGGDEAPYTLVDLGGFTGGDFVQAWAKDVNNPEAAGLMFVVGYSFAPNGDEHAALWDVTAGGQILNLTDIAPPGYVDSSARKVNDAGLILVGGFVSVPGKGLLTLPGLGGGDGLPGGLNEVGDIVGSAPDAEGNDHGALWHIDQQGQITGPVDLGHFFARDVNNNGLMAGWQGFDGAIAWFDDGGELQVHRLGALDPQGTTEAIALNDHGMVAGNSHDPSGREAFVWTAETGMVGLGSLGGNESVATDVNNSGQIVGWSRSGGRFPQVAFVWQNGQMFDLNQITDGGGGKNWIQIASGINDAGHIVGLLTRTKPVSEQHGFLLVPNAQ